MKFAPIAIVVFSLTTGFATGAVAQGRHDEPGRQHGVLRASGVGVITSLNAPAKKITLEHEPIDKLKMPAATHEFKLKSTKTAGKLSEGDKVAFEVEKSGPDLTVSRLSKRK